MGLDGVESVPSRGNSRQKSGEDALPAKLQGGERKHTLSIYNRSAQLESGIWGRAGPGFKGKKLKQFSSASHENTSQEEAAQMLVHNGVYSLAPNTQHLKYRLVLIYFEAEVRLLLNIMFAPGLGGQLSL